MMAAQKPNVAPPPLPSWIAPRPRPEGRSSPFAAKPRAPITPPPFGRDAGSARGEHREASRSGEMPAVAPPSLPASAIDAPPPSVRSMGAMDSKPRPSIHHRPNEPSAAELAMQAEIAGLQGALASAVAEAARARREVMRASAPELVRLAVTIAEQVIGQRLAADPGLVPRLAREGIDALLEHDDLVVAVGSDLAAKVPADVWAAALEGRATVMTDPSLDPMGCEVRGKTSRVAVDPWARLRAVSGALDGDRGSAPPEEVP